MTPAADIVVVGGGIAGLTIALAVAARRRSVCLLDSPRMGSASRAAAGMLAPSVEGLPDSILPAAIAARDFYPEFLARLATRANVHVALDRRGILELASTDAQLQRLASRAAADALVLDTHALRQLEPAFATHAGAILHPHDGAVDNVALMHALERAVSREPSIERVVAVVESIACAEDGATVITASTHRIPCGRVVLAAGAWMSAINGLPRTIPVRPVRGQLMLIGEGGVGHVTYGGGGYLVPRGPGLVVGATSEEAGFENQTTEAGRSALLAIARAASPVFDAPTVREHWAGLRPMSPDSFPLLGADPLAASLVYACGFSRNGILLAPWAASQLARLLCDGTAPDVLRCFAVDRFGEK